MKVEVKPATLADLAAINQIYNHYIVHTSVTFDLEAWSEEKRKNWFREFNQPHSPYYCLVAKQGDQTVGFAYNGRFREKTAYQCTSEVTIYTRPEAAQKGIGTVLMTKLLKLLEQSEIHQLVSLITLPNDASVRLHEKFGFNKVGVLAQVGHKLGQYHDVLMMQRGIKE